MNKEQNQNHLQPHFEYKCESCNNPMSVRSFFTCTLYFCPECANYKRTENECTHEFILVLFQLENGSSQLRNYCPKCHHRDPKILKQKDYDLTKVQIKEEKRYQDFYSGLWKREAEIYGPFIEELQRKQKAIMEQDYSRYITSEEWKKLRSLIIERDNKTCQICGSKADHVHHLTYAHFKQEYPFELVSLCAICHDKEYHSPEAKKRIESLNIPVK